MELFHNDYNVICHPAILDRMNRETQRQMNGYGADECCESAADKIRKLCQNESLSVHFLVGGTQTNLTVIDAALRPHQAALGAISAHINVHETGAVEATGHKVLWVPSEDGKITADQIRQTVEAHFNDEAAEHTAQPKLVYISDSTELGTVYTLAELEAISAACKEHNMYLFADGARLGYALTAEGSDVTLADLARLTDVFYIGGTKVGAMFGEAVVISNPAIAEDFRYLIKQHGGMLAKGWLLGMQFDVLMENNLYFDIARYANLQADRIRACLKEIGYPLYVEGNTNQIFAVLPDNVLEKLSRNFAFSEQCRVDSAHRAVRFCTSWATRPESVDSLCRELRKLAEKA